MRVAHIILFTSVDECLKIWGPEKGPQRSSPFPFSVGNDLPGVGNEPFGDSRIEEAGDSFSHSISHSLPQLFSDPGKNKLRRYPQQHAVLFLVLAPPLAEPRKTLVKTLVEPWWNLTPGPPRTTPQPIWAGLTPKLSAVGEQGNPFWGLGHLFSGATEKNRGKGIGAYLFSGATQKKGKK